MANGVIKRLVAEKGFGFIEAGVGDEYFFHRSAVQNAKWEQLTEGQAVSFEVGQSAKGPRAEKIQVAA